MFDAELNSKMVSFSMRSGEDEIFKIFGGFEESTKFYLPITQHLEKAQEPGSCIVTGIYIAR